MSSSIRVAIVSDTHGQLDPRIAREASASDVVVHAGDIGARAVLDALVPPGGELLAVRGNNDVPEKWAPEERAYLEALPWEATLALPGGELVVVHGHRAGSAARRHARLRRDYPGARAVVYGHTHRPCADRSRRPWIINPGAAGRARTFGGPSYCLLYASQRRWLVKEKRLEPMSARLAG